MRGVALALLLLAGCVAGRGGGDDGVPIGRQARARQGTEPLAAPPADVGIAEDPHG